MRQYHQPYTFVPKIRRCLCLAPRMVPIISAAQQPNFPLVCLCFLASRHPGKCCHSQQEVRSRSQCWCWPRVSHELCWWRLRRTQIPTGLLTTTKLWTFTLLRTYYISNTLLSEWLVIMDPRDTKHLAIRRLMRATYDACNHAHHHCLF